MLLFEHWFAGWFIVFEINPAACSQPFACISHSLLCVHIWNLSFYSTLKWDPENKFSVCVYLISLSRLLFLPECPFIVFSQWQALFLRIDNYEEVTIKPWSGSKKQLYRYFCISLVAWNFSTKKQTKNNSFPFCLWEEKTVIFKMIIFGFSSDISIATCFS